MRGYIRCLDYALPNGINKHSTLIDIPIGRSSYTLTIFNRSFKYPSNSFILNSIKLRRFYFTKTYSYRLNESLKVVDYLNGEAIIDSLLIIYGQIKLNIGTVKTDPKFIEDIMSVGNYILNNNVL